MICFESVMTEESFPRGGKPKSASKKPQKRAKSDENDLFKISTRVSELKKPKKKDRRKHPLGGNDSLIEEVVVIDKFSYDSVVDDMLLLGRVKEIHDYKVLVGLPENIVGEVAITDISPAYTAALKQIASSAEESDVVGSLEEIFTVGQIICCRVKKFKHLDKKKEIHLTVDPNSVNRDIQFDKITVNCVLNGCVDSKEDHGYTVDLGRGLKAFVPNSDAEKFSGGSPLLVGTLIQCSINKNSIDSVKLNDKRVVSVKLKTGKAKVSSDQQQCILTNILPGTLVSGTVKSVQQKGILIDFCGKYRGYVHRHQLNNDPSKFTKDQQITACVLYHQPLVGVSCLSMLGHLTESDSSKLNHFQLVNVGDLFKSAKLVNIDGNSGALLRLKNDINGYLPVKHVHDRQRRCKLSDLPKTGIKCRVLDFDIMNNVAIVSTAKSFIYREILNITDCKPGQVIEGKIQRFVDGNIIVLIDGLYRGMIPMIHNANVPLKRPELKYKIDERIKCRILKFEKKMRNAVILTAKESLINTKLPILNDFDQLERGMVVEGFIVKITPHGLVVVFYNDVRGFVYRTEAGQDLNVLQDHFYVGQVVKCRVMSWCDDTHKIQLSMKLEGQEQVGKKELKLQAALDAGVLHQCKVIKVTNRGLSVRVGDVSGLIPTNHLSDNLTNCTHLLQLYKPHQAVQDLALFERAATPIFSLKKTLVDAVREGRLPQEIDELLPGTTVNAVARNTVSYGIFVQISPSLRGIAINKFLMDHSSAEDAAKKYQFGQSILVNIKELDPERNRILCSLRMSDCYNGETQPAVNLLKSYLDERERILDHYKQSGRDAVVNLLQYGVGSVIQVVIDQLSSHGAIGHELASRVKVVCTIFHMAGSSIKVGEVRQAVVLHHDLDICCLEVSLSHKVVKAISHRVDGRSNQVKEGVVTDAEVVLVKPDFVLIGLKGRAEFKLAYAPAQKCLNDVNGSEFFEPGFSDKVVVKSVEKVVVCSWQAFEGSSGSEREPKRVDAHKLKVGSKVRVLIKQVLPFQLNIRIGNLPGRIFASEIEPQGAVTGEPITSRYNAGDTVDAVVIGFRCPKSQKAQTSLSEQSKSIPECSLLKKKFDGDMEERLGSGDSVHGFYQQMKDDHIVFRLTPTITADCRLLNADPELVDVSNPEHLQSGGCYPLTVVAAKTESANTLEVAMVQKTDIDIGSVIIANVMKVKKDSLLVRLTGNYRGIVHMTELVDEYQDRLISKFRVGEYKKCLVIGKVRYEKNEVIRKGSFRVSFRQSRFKPLCARNQPRDKVVEKPSDLIVNEIVRGFVSMSTQNSVYVLLGRNLYGVAEKEHLCDHHLTKVKAAYPKGKVVTVKILSVQKKKVAVSLKASDTGVIDPRVEKYIVKRARRNSDRVSESSNGDLAHAAERKRKISETESEGHSSNRKRKNSESETDGPSAHRKRKISETESGAGSQRKRRESETETSRARKDSETESPALGTRKRRLSEMSETKEDDANSPVEESLADLPMLEVDSSSSSEDEEEVVEPEPVKKKRKVPSKKTMNGDKTGAQRLNVKEEFAWVTDFNLPTKRRDDSDSSDEDEEKIVSTVKGSKKLEEKKLMEMENRLLDSSRKPETEDEFDRLVVQTPDSSLIWLQYMAHHLKMVEIDKGRKVAERALKTISFREEQEKLNVWVALLNLENTYGTPEQLKDVFDRALQMNDPYKVHCQLVNIYENSSKAEQAERLHSTIVRQFGVRKEVWISFGKFYFSQRRFDSARRILERSLKSLDKKDHMEVVTKFARLEFEHDQYDQGVQMFERVLAECPRRVDVWMVYIDLLIKYSTPDKIRKVFLRILELKIPAKKMRSVFKKWLEFETKFGDDETVSEVKERAAKYVQSNLDH